jgi:hypothetical protein
MVRLAGLEPARALLSSLLIVAFLCGVLPLPIRAICLQSKAIVANLRIHRQKNLCGIVRVACWCAGIVRNQFLCGTVR